MLQIISGKFFKSTERHITPRIGIIYSNFSHFAPIKTCIATLEPVDTLRFPSSYILKYTEQIEKMRGGPYGGELVATGGQEIFDQFELILTIGFGAWFSNDRNEIEFACRRHRRNSQDLFVPSSFVPGVFEPQKRATPEQVFAFEQWVLQIIGLKRIIYENVIEVLRGMKSALGAINYNIDLSYSMLVYCLESLAQNSEPYEPRWEDFEENARTAIDKVLKNSPATATEIHNILIKGKQLKLMKRFIGFIVKNTSDDFFTSEAESSERPIRRSEFVAALESAYNLRSKFTHELKPIHEQLRNQHFGHRESLVWDKTPYLTLAGMFRLTTHVLRNFVNAQCIVTQEDFDWRGALPNVATVKSAPIYWIENASTLNEEGGVQRLEGVLDYLVDVSVNRDSSNKVPPVNLGPLVKRCEQLLPQSNARNRRALLCICVLWNHIIPLESRVGDWAAIDKEYEKEEQTQCSMESLALRVMLGVDFPWALADCVATYGDWQRKKTKASSIEISLPLDLAIIGRLVNASRSQGMSLHTELLRMAILEAAGLPVFQKEMRRALETNADVDVTIFLPHLRVSTKEEGPPNNAST